MAKRKKPPIESAQYQIEKQVSQIRGNTTLGEQQQAQIVDWLTGLASVAGGINQVVDPANPPSPDSIHGKLIALGRSQRSLSSILSGGDAAVLEPQGAPEADPADVAI
jgi:hypothetical protein